MTNNPPNNRRSFFAIVATVVAGTLALLTPLVAGVVTFLSPLFKKSGSAKVRIALLDQVPDDGLPRAFPVVADRVDAWTKYPEQRIGSVYLVRKQGEEKPTAFTAKCPHAGCFIGYTPGDDLFRCPCHTSAFKLDGTRARGDAEVAPRDMDQLPVELRTVGEEPAGHGLQLRRRRRLGRGAPDRPDEQATAQAMEVWVDFIDFQTGHKEAIATT
jgi:menaquinol-cytochrome c reductase iron-sulfur subunit